MAVRFGDKGPERGMRPLSGLRAAGTSQLPDCGVINAGRPEVLTLRILFKETVYYKSVTLR
jgi:hypothetical protein